MSSSANSSTLSLHIAVLPERNSIDQVAKPYWEVWGDLTIGEDLLLCVSRIVVPQSLWDEILKKLHQGHQEIQRSCLHAQSLVWLGLFRQISNLVKSAPEMLFQTRSYSCLLLFLANTRLRLVYIAWSNIPSLVVDYFLWYLEVIQLKSMISQCIFLLWDSGNLRQCNLALRNLLSLLPAVFIFCKATVMGKGLRKQWKISWKSLTISPFLCFHTIQRVWLV